MVTLFSPGMHTVDRAQDGWESMRALTQVTIANKRQIPVELIKQGQVVVPAIRAALHGPAAAEKPLEFDPIQKAKRNLVFGMGNHFCPGAAMSRQWLHVGIQTLFSSLPGLEMARTPNEILWSGGSLPAPVFLEAQWQGPVRARLSGLFDLLADLVKK